MKLKPTGRTTQIVHPSYQAPKKFAGMQPPLYRASTVLFDNVADMHARTWQSPDDYVYGLRGTPTTYQLANQLAEIEGGKFCTLVPSGLSAITLPYMALLKAGDELLLQDTSYGPAAEFAIHVLKNFGVTLQTFDPMNLADAASKFTPRTKLMWLEAASSVSMEVPDIPALCALAKRHQVLVGMDNTWSAGMALQPFELGVDISIHALTKYQSGGGDVLMGSVITNDEALHMTIKAMHMRLGLGVSADDCATILRSLPSMPLRYQAADQSAQKLAHWCKTRPEFVRVLHPALPDCPGHEFWQRDFKGAAGIFSVLFDPTYSQQQVYAFVDRLRYFKIGYSWAGPMSLAVPYNMTSIRKVWPRPEWGNQAVGQLVRFCVGLEDTDDLIADIEQALSQLQAS